MYIFMYGSEHGYIGTLIFICLVECWMELGFRYVNLSDNGGIVGFGGIVMKMWGSWESLVGVVVENVGGMGD